MTNVRQVQSATALLVLLASTVHGAPAAGMSHVLTAETAPAGASSNSAPIAADTGSYDVGLMLGSQLEHNGLAPNLSMDALIRGLKESLAGHAPTAQERDAAMKFTHDARDALTEKNRDAGTRFLAQNAKQPGVVALPSGLQYRVLAVGDKSGKSPLPSDQVTVRYTAALADGTVFDRSETHDAPASFRVNSVFKGWQEAFLAMKPGAKWELFVPPELGYGKNPPSPIPPGAVLVYELELLRVEPVPMMDPAAAHRPATDAKPGARPPPAAP